MSTGTGELTAWLRAMPKAELHLHLDGSLRPRTALELAQHRDIGVDLRAADVPAMRDLLVAPERCDDQADLLRAFALPVALLQDVEALTRCTAELVEDIASEGTHYAEIRWAPSLHTARGLSLREGIDAVTRAATGAAERVGIEVRLIAVALRTHDSAVALEVARIATTFVGDGLTGFDLAGVEQDAPDPRRFRAAFEAAREGGLGITCHAGEWGGAAQVRATLAIDPWRIAHGAPAADDRELMDELRERAVTLDICPTSNFQAGVGRGGSVAFLPRLIDAGVPVTINTDDRTVSDLTLVREMERAVLRLGVTPGQLAALTRHAHKAAFLQHDEGVRSSLAAAFETWLSDNPPPQSPLQGTPLFGSG